MAKQLSRFEPVADVPGVFTASKANLRCTAIKLRSGRLCLYSPVAGLSQAAKDSLRQIGEVAFLLAPNHYHNKGIAEYTAAFPKAQIVAPDGTRQRLKKVTGITFRNLDGLIADLPKGMHLVQPQGLKTGEVWIITDTTGAPTWLVVDAFTSKTEAGETTAMLLKTFPTYGVKDPVVYATWAKQTITSDPPHILIPCHGDIVRGPSLGCDLDNLIAQLV